MSEAMRKAVDSLEDWERAFWSGKDRRVVDSPVAVLWAKPLFQAGYEAGREDARKEIERRLQRQIEEMREAYGVRGHSEG